jgi:Prenyltransferase and squalene oxidase repeat
MHTVNPERVMDLVVVGVSSAGWEMFDFGHNGVPRDEYTDATVHFMKSVQSADGHWETVEGRRPPMNVGDYQATALAIYTLKTYGPPAEKADTEKAIARAAAWLETARPVNTQDRAFHLLGLAWSNARPAAVVAAAHALMATQQPDGGWKQMPTLSTDAYATGQALYALSVAARTPATHPIYAKGVRYLLDTQAPDGSWLVKSRSIWVQPYFESGFPYAHDQWISAAGTS